MASTPTTIVNLRHHMAQVNCSRGYSIFSNPYMIGRDGTRDDVCDQFIPYFYKKLLNPEFHAKVLTLKGKRLGCWCRCIPECNNPKCNNPKCKAYRCHLETIVEYLEK